MVAAKKNERGEHRAAFAVGALLGGAAGAVWTLFNVPRSGAATRAEIVRVVETAAGSVRSAVVGAREQVRETGERAADRVALAVDAVTGGRADDATEPLPTVSTAPPTASSPSSAAGVAATSVDPAAPVATDGPVGNDDRDDLVLLDVAPGSRTEDLARPPGGSSTATS